MSRRCHHGSPRHARPPARERRRDPIVVERPQGLPDASTGASPLAEPHAQPGAADTSVDLEIVEVEATDPEPPGREAPAARLPFVRPATRAPIRPRTVPSASAGATARRSSLVSATSVAAATSIPAGFAQETVEHGATAPQLRRFIKSRAYVPLHELRRRFGINGTDDDVTVLDVDEQRVYVGLPTREGQLLGELLRGGDIGVELSLDPIAPIVVGVYPTRPIPRT